MQDNERPDTTAGYGPGDVNRYTVHPLLNFFTKKRKTFPKIFLPVFYRKIFSENIFFSGDILFSRDDLPLCANPALKGGGGGCHSSGG
jgi:hypothetical protein